MEPPQDILDECSGVAAFHIYAQSWQTPNHTTSTTESASLELRQIILEADDEEEAIYSTICALHKFACKAPAALDHVLIIMAQGFAQLPETTELPGIKDPEDALLILKRWLVDWAQRFKGSAYGDDWGEESERGPIDARETKDGTNVFFGSEEVSSDIDGVLEKARNLQQARLEFIVALAMQGRCHSVGVSHWDIMDSAVPLIDNALVPHNPDQVPIWGKAGVIGCSVLLRGCARTLFERVPAELRGRKRVEWVEGFGRFLNHDPCGALGGDFVLKVHAARAIGSVRSEDTVDEDSTRLFALVDWVS